MQQNEKEKKLFRITFIVFPLLVGIILFLSFTSGILGQLIGGGMGRGIAAMYVVFCYPISVLFFNLFFLSLNYQKLTEAKYIALYCLSFYSIFSLLVGWLLFRSIIGGLLFMLPPSIFLCLLMLIYNKIIKRRSD